MGTITAFTVPLSRLTRCLQQNDDQLLEESFKGLFWLHWSLVASMAHLEEESWSWWHIQEILPQSASSSPSAGLGLPWAFVLHHWLRLWKRQKGINTTERKTGKGNSRNGGWRGIMWSLILIICTHKKLKPMALSFSSHSMQERDTLKELPPISFKPGLVSLPSTYTDSQRFRLSSASL